MRKSEISRKVQIPRPFEAADYKTERSAVAIFMHWMREIIEQKNLDLGPPNVETSGADRKLPDLVIYESRRSQNVLCVIEAKQPYFDVFNYKELKKPAWEKANFRKAKYFATTNFKELIWFKTENVNVQKPEEEQVIEKYHLSGIEDLNQIEETRYKKSIIRQLERFLNKLYAVHTGKESEPKQAIDEFLVYRLQSKIEMLSRYYTTIIYNLCHKDDNFSLKLSKWFVEQGWSFTWQAQDFEKAARQTAYLLVNKILFYNVLQAKRPNDLAPLRIPQGLIRGAQLQKILQSFFDEVLNIDYETIYTTDFIDSAAFPNEKEVVEEIKESVDILGQYDFSKLGYDIVGGIFERLISSKERHNLGQYFTNPDVVDIILRFCMKHEDDKVFDPACGAGTFLVRAYQHKKLMNQRLGHEDILSTLWGTDISKFPAHLSTINLAIKDLGVDKNYPNISQEDFFRLLSTEGGFELTERWRKAIRRTLSGEKREIIYPRWFDCIVGNPPYTRQEEMREIAPKIKEYKEKIIESSLKDNAGKKIANISRRAGIHAYFFVHGMKFLRNGGKFGFIVSNSWLDVDYGKGLQEFFLKNCKIIAIIESKVERWFEEADVNTCIVILEKCDEKEERDENLARFVYLKKPLSYFIPPTQEIWEREVERLNEIDKLIKTVLAHSEFYQNDEMRIFPKKQAELWKKGFDEERKRYVGTKWGKYLRVPEIFFRILNKGRDKLVPLKEIADVRRGFTTGANEFFYLTEEEIKRRRIEREFWMHQDENGNWIPNYVIKSPRECKSIVVKPEDLKYRVLMILKDKNELEGTNVLKYIKDGERRGFHQRPTCASRGERWYKLLETRGEVLCMRGLNERHIFWLNSGNFIDARFCGISLKSRRNKNSIVASILNSSFTSMLTELSGRLNLGQGALDVAVYEYEAILMVNPDKISSLRKDSLVKAFDKLSERQIGSAFSELGAFSPEEVSLEKVKPDRRELDKIVMGEILGLTDEEQIEVYRAVVDLVKSRIEKAKSFGNKKRTKEGIDVDLLIKTVMEKLGEDTLGKFYRERVLSQECLSIKNLPKVSGEVKLEQDLLGWRLSARRKHLTCTSEAEARYLKVWLEIGLESIKVPESEDYLKKIVLELESLKRKADEVFENYIGSVLDIKARQKILRQLWQEVLES